MINHLHPNRRHKRKRDTEYMLWVKSLPCVICYRFTFGPDLKNWTYGRIWQGVITEAAHTGPHGMGQKAPDNQCIPLCAEHHREGKFALDKIGPKAFSAHFGLKIPELVAALQNRFAAEKAA